MANIEKSQWGSVFGEINEDLCGDFIGFTWDGMSMSRLGIARTSGGNRYNENLLPTMQDKTTQIPGADGTYYFNSFYTQKPFSISFAFDRLTEKGLRQLKQLFGDKGIHRLSFDEQPYKEYMVKVTGQPQLKYIPFDDESEDDEPETITSLYEVEIKEIAKDRIYKGEGTLILTAFTPYARSRAKSITEMTEVLSTKEDVYMVYKDQWQAASGILDNLTIKNVNGDDIVFDQKDSDNEIRVYNPGDREADFMLTIEPSLSTPIQLNLYEIPNGSTAIEFADAYLAFTIPKLKAGDSKIRINSKVELIEGLDENEGLTGNLYNECIGYGWFFKIPTNKNGSYHMIKTDGANIFTQTNKLSIEYNYWYF